MRNEVFKRRYTNEQVLNQAKIFHKHGVSVRYDFIFDNPFESFEESLETIYMMIELPKPASFNLFSLKYFPNTEITIMAKDAGFITNANIDDNQEKDHDTYTIHQEKGSIDNQFINHLAFYISNISNAPINYEQNNKILKTIEDYRKSKNIAPIKDMVRKYLNNTE